MYWVNNVLLIIMGVVTAVVVTNGFNGVLTVGDDVINTGAWSNIITNNMYTCITYTYTCTCTCTCI